MYQRTFRKRLKCFTFNSETLTGFGGPHSEPILKMMQLQGEFMSNIAITEAVSEPKAHRCREPMLELAQGPRLLYSRKEAARQLSISIRSLDYLIAAKAFQTRRLGKKILIPHAELVRFARGSHFGPISSDK
jgi:hypothetical protein